MATVLGFAGACAAACSIAVSTVAFAQQEFDRPIRMVLGYPPGGAADVMTRTIANDLGPRTKQVVVVENRPGANGVVAAQFVKQTRRDQYTLFLSDTSLYSLAVNVQKNFPVDVLKELQPVIIIGSAPLILAGGAKVPATNMAELIRYAKVNPGMQYGSTGTGGYHHVALEYWGKLTGVELAHVPFQNPGQRLIALGSGDLSLSWVSGANLRSLDAVISKDQLKLYAVAAPRRLASRMDIPTMAEAGVPGFSLEATFAIFAHPDTPRPVINALNAALRDGLASAEIVKRFDQFGIEIYPRNSVDEATGILRAEYDLYGKVARELGRKIE
ncbi:MAG: Bug family tripartite tricarboxylate transporter substrate binding protein [Burkholderiales bacterium]